MAAKVFCHFFYGSDSRRSLIELQGWVNIFTQKYGNVTRYTIEGDEQSLDESWLRLQQYLQGVSLFPEPQLIVIKRLASNQKVTAGQKKVFEQIVQAAAHLPAQTTLLLWESFDLPTAHPLVSALQKLTAEGRAALHLFQVPTESGLSQSIRQQLQPLGMDITAEALTWVKTQYRLLGLVQTAERKALLEERSWWLANVLEGAALRAETSTIDLSSLQGEQTFLSPIAPFALTKTIVNQQWSLAHQESRRFIAQATPGDYFALWGALKWQVRQTGNRLNQLEIRIIERFLAEIEVLSKSTTLEPAWSLHQLLCCLEREQPNNMLPLRIVWLASL